eukprot:8517897-Alexandrium_andersonii.AAC.1
MPSPSPRVWEIAFGASALAAVSPLACTSSAPAAGNSSTCWVDCTSAVSYTHLTLPTICSV